MFVILVLCSRTAYFIKNLSLTKITNNLITNFTTVSTTAEYCWDISQRFDGCSLILNIFNELHAWYWFSSWSTFWLCYRSIIFILGLRVLLAKFYDYLLRMYGEALHQEQDPDPDPHLKHLLWHPKYRSPRREQRRFRKYQKRYQVHSITNGLDIYETLRHGGLTHFTLSGRWIIRFCSGLGCLGQVFGAPANILSDYTTDKSGFSEWLWPGRPPGTFLEHVLSSTICTFLVLASFAITVLLATARIRSRSKKGAISSYLRTFVAKELRLDRLLLALLSWGIVDLTCISHEATWIYLPIGIALALELFRIALRFDKIRKSAAVIANIISLPRRTIRWIILKSSNSIPVRTRHIRKRSSRRQKFRRHAHCTAFNVDKRVPSTYLVDFDDSAIATIICDNSANIHICNDRNMFASMTAASVNKVVATIGGQVNFPAGIGTVKWSWRDELGEVHTYLIKNVHYFPSSPVNILGITAFGRQLNDDETTGIDTKWKRSRFYWEGGHERWINHPSSQLPEMPLVMDPLNNAFCSYIARCEASTDDTVHFCNSSCYSASNDVTIAMALNTQADDIDVSPFEIGERLFFTNEGHTSLVRLRDILEDEGATKFVVELPGNRMVTTTCDHLKSPSQPDIARIPILPDDYRQDASNLSDEQLEKLASPQALSPEQQELMSYHQRLLHLPFFILHRMAQLGIIPRRLTKLKEHPPHCASCSFGQAHRRPWRSKRTKDGKKSSIRRDSDDKPGAGVSIDQMISAQPGLVPQVSGRLTSARIWAATIFLDHFSRHVHVHLMRDQTQASTLEAKAGYERHANTFGITVNSYRADNGRFAEEDFREEVKRCLQTITFCGVGAHHQNGLAERVIKDLTLTTRTLLLHAKRHWPEMITTMLWPMALKAAEERLNSLSLDMDGKTPLSKWSNSDCQIFVKDFHPWGCPVFVLDGRLQSNPKGVPKWEPRARVGVYMGHSPSHAGSVALVLNPTSGHISPQFHVAFDDNFGTVPYMREGTIPPHWAELVRNSAEIATDENFDIARTWFEGAEDPTDTSPLDLTINPSASLSTPANEGAPSAYEGAPSANEGATTQPTASPTASPSEGAAGILPQRPPLAPVEVDDNNPFDLNAENAPPGADSTPFQASEGDSLKMPKRMNLEKSGLRRSPRLIAHKPKLTALVTGIAVFLAGVSNVVFPTIEGKNDLSFTQKAAHRYHTVNSNVDGTINGILGSVFSSVVDNDSYTYSGMLKQPDKHQFIEAMLTETAVHEKRNHWTIMKRKDMPSAAKTILSIWSFKRKRLPDGQISKYKARLCAHGGMQSWGVDYWETYAPVVNWMSVRFILTIAKIHKLDTKVIDFVLAFPQAKLDVDVFMEVPAGMVLTGVPGGNQRSLYVLSLNRSLYGLKQASANWYEMLTKGLQDRGFKSSNVDPCVQISDKAIILVYVDDCIVISRESGYINSFIKSLQDGPENFEFTDEGSLESYLGVKFIDYDKGDQFEMTQPFLINRIIESLGFEQRMTNAQPSPAVKPLLHRDLDGEPRRTPWNYRSVIGMMNYLQQSTRPDLAFAVHQCARFCNDPKRSHERAVKRIGKYLLGTKERGITCRPDKNKGLECYVDADFAGSWDSGDSDNPENVMSRTGYIIQYAGCPVVWCSKLQTEIALSTMEAEYIALSQAMREVIPLIAMMDELESLIPFFNPTPQIRCKLFEDNRSCIIVAESARLTPRTKHIAIKYHHFRQFVKNGSVKIYPIGTREQVADIFTKPLDEGQFKYLRNLFLRW